MDELDLSSGVSRGRTSSSQAVLDLEPEPEPAAASDLDLTGSGPLADLPLGQTAAAANGTGAPVPLPEANPAREGTAPLRSRLAALAADFAFVLLLTAAPLLAATAGPARSLSPDGLWWTAAFALYLSFFATVIPLSLFGKTVGMALTGLTARAGPDAPPLTIAECSRRWLGTLIAVAGLGAPLLVGRDPELPSVADRFSGRPLSFEEL